MPWWVRGLVLVMLLAGAGRGTSELEPPSNIMITNDNGHLSATWDWDSISSDDDADVTFTAFYQKSGTFASAIPGCIRIEEYTCYIPPELLDSSYNYTLQVRVETPRGDSLSNSINLGETEPPPVVHVYYDDGNVIVNISTRTPLLNYADITYKIVLRNNESNMEKPLLSNHAQCMLPSKEIFPDVTYCVRAQIFNFENQVHGPFSPAVCFKIQHKGPKNLRVESLDTKCLLKWDWDYEQDPDATFSVDRCFEGGWGRTTCSKSDHGKCDSSTEYVRSIIPNKKWRKVEGCDNITTAQCDVSNICTASDYTTIVFRASVCDGQRDERSSSTVQFRPDIHTVIGPPTNINTTLIDNELYIIVSAPEGLKLRYLETFCTWVYHLEFWNNGTRTRVTYKENLGPHFRVEDLEASATYCMRVQVRCADENRTGLYSKDHCITTGHRSYVTEWITGSVFIAILVISVVAYVCLCPLKRYIQHIFFPSSKLPSSIGKGMQESPRNSMKNPFLLHEEEITDRCYIIQNTQPEDLVQIDKNTSEAKYRDSGNYSNEDEVTVETDICTQ